ncbi:hypothetical protein [Microcoleus sp. B4-C1]|uniref:hypothetical protein n=1 Tax=Microcoleus sp. B4-C1 TaxID=2818660 RepID=UPI002FCF2501
MQNPIIVDGHAFRIPGVPSRYRANCSRDFGVFVTGDTKGLNILEVQEKKLSRGKFVEMAVCAIGSKTLTFEPNYVNEEFTEIWGFPVSGGMKDYFHANCSELSTFLIHRQSRDKLKTLVESFSQQAFNAWVAEGMPGNYEEYARSKAADALFTNIFRFELTKQESREYGAYYSVSVSVRPPNGALDEAALKAARQVHDAEVQGTILCEDIRLVENEQICVASMPAAQSPALPEAELQPPAINVTTTSAKQIKSAK